MKQLILGGVRSGKSRLAEKLALASGKNVTYVATATANDSEMDKRILSHKASRPSEWGLVEEPLSLSTVIDSHAHEEGCLLIDCLTLWLTNLLCHRDTTILVSEIERFHAALVNAKGDIIMVSNETGLGVVPMGELSRRFCDEAGVLHQAVASECERVILIIAGLPHCLKGEKVEF